MSQGKPQYMTTFKERISYWTYFVGQNVYYNITAAFISTYLAMQGPTIKIKVTDKSNFEIKKEAHVVALLLY